MELLLVLAVFLAFILFSNNRRAKQAKALEASVAVGSQVIMLGGIKGKVVSVLEETVIVETTPGTRIEFVKAAVRTAVAPAETKSSTKTQKVTTTTSTAVKPVKKATPASSRTSAAKKTAK
jgi:preprotein translocase subunit YajC